VNYREARQRTTDGRWDWTNMNDKVVTTAAPCTDHSDGHATQEEADRHFYDHEVANLREFHLEGTQHHCAVDGCDNWTGGGLESRWLGQGTMLCEDHDSRDGWMAANPFSSPIHIIASW